MPTDHEAVHSEDKLSALSEAIHGASGSLQNAASQVGATAKTAVHKAAGVANTGAYRAAYGLAYGVVFSGVFLVELLPENNVFRRGFEDGAEEGFDAALVKAEARKGKRPAVTSDEEELAFDDAEAAPKKKATRAAK
jgi:hypothetical protein